MHRLPLHIPARHLAEHREIGLSAMTRQWLHGGHISDPEKLRAEIAAWLAHVKTLERGAD